MEVGGLWSGVTCILPGQLVHADVAKELRYSMAPHHLAVCADERQDKSSNDSRSF